MASHEIDSQRPLQGLFHASHSGHMSRRIGETTEPRIGTYPQTHLYRLRQPVVGQSAASAGSDTDKQDSLLPSPYRRHHHLQPTPQKTVASALTAAGAASCALGASHSCNLATHPKALLQACRPSLIACLSSFIGLSLAVILLASPDDRGKSAWDPELQAQAQVRSCARSLVRYIMDPQPL